MYSQNPGVGYVQILVTPVIKSPGLLIREGSYFKHRKSTLERISQLLRQHKVTAVSEEVPRVLQLTSGTRHVRLLAAIFCSAMSKALDRPADRSLAHRNCANPIEELAPLVVGGPGTRFDVFLKQQHGMLIQLRRFVGPVSALGQESRSRRAA